MSKPFNFRPNRRVDSDGGNRRICSNGDNANNAADMLALIRDHDHLDNRECLTDTLTNLMHWADREGVDFDACLASATTHHEMER